MYQSSRRSPGHLQTVFIQINQVISDKERAAPQQHKIQGQAVWLRRAKAQLTRKELVLRMEALKVEVEHKCMQFKVDLLHQHLQLLKEGVSQEE